MYWKSELPERRRHPRVSTTMPVQYRGIRQANENSVSATSRDISISGMRLLVNEFISVFTRLVIDVPIPSTPKPIRAVSKVAWIQKRPYGEQYELGLHFLDITEDDRRDIHEYVEKLTPKQ